jgi:hypothetical protein
MRICAVVIQESGVATESTRQGRAMPRFLYISDDEERTIWQRELPPTGRVAWRLLAGNNRSLGQSAGTFATLAECVAAATRLHDEARQAASSVLFDISMGRHWRWTVLLDGQPVAVAAHSYGRKLECARALEQFLELVARAEPAPERLSRFGPNALRPFGLTNESNTVSTTGTDSSVVLGS